MSSAQAETRLALRLSVAGLSATGAQLVCQPIETVKIRLQLRDATDVRSPFRGYRSFPTGFGLLTRKEGFIALWKSMAPSALREMSYSSLGYGRFLPVKEALGTSPDGSTPT